MTPEEVLVGLAAWGVPDAGARLPDRPLAREAWQQLQDGVARQRLWGLLGASIANGDLPATEDQAARAEATHRVAMSSGLELEAMAVTAIEALEQKHISARLLKGIAIAHLDETDPSLRCFNDVDLLVRPHQLPEAVEVLECAGYQRDLPERRPGFDRQFAKEATMTSQRGREVDLHRTLALGAFGLTIDLEDLWSASSMVMLAGVPHTALDADRRLLHACYAAVLGDPVPRLVLLRDIGLLLTGGRIDVDNVREVARAWRGEAVLARGIVLASDALRSDGWALVEWARALRPSRWDARALAAYQSQGGTNTRVLLSGVLAPMGTHARATYLRALLMPSAEYVRARRRAGRPAELRTGLRELLRRR